MLIDSHGSGKMAPSARALASSFNVFNDDLGVVYKVLKTHLLSLLFGVIV